MTNAPLFEKVHALVRLSYSYMTDCPSYPAWIVPGMSYAARKSKVYTVPQTFLMQIGSQEEVVAKDLADVPSTISVTAISGINPL